MKKLLFLLISMACLKGFSQTNIKEEVFAKIESNAWINFYLLENYTTLNLKEEHWNWILKNDFQGLSSVNRLGNDISNFYELTADPQLLRDCRYTNSQHCIDRINNAPNKIYVEMNAMNLKMDEVNIKLAMHALSAIAGFIGSDNIYGSRAGWRPKTASTKFILNIDNAIGQQPKVIWNADGSVATVTMFVGSEAPDWYANLLKKLHRGK